MGGGDESKAPDSRVQAGPGVWEGLAVRANGEPVSSGAPAPAVDPVPASQTAGGPDGVYAPPPPLRVAAWQWIKDYFLGEEPSFLAALVPFCFLSMALFTRHPIKTNFIFDEQEALLANPYVRSVTEAHPKFGWLDAFKRDFWGLGPERSIGSYRPIPNLLWRSLWFLGAREHNPFLHHWVNVLLHGANAALLTVVVWRFTRSKGAAWLAGLFLASSAVLTEAVSGVVGIADVLGALGCLLALLALTYRLPFMALGVFFGTLFGLYSKESAMLCVPMVPLFAWATASAVFPRAPRRILRVLVALAAAASAFVLYVELRRRLFPAPMPPELSAAANEGKGAGHRAFAAIMRWYAQPVLPKDPLNNPLVTADMPHRIAGALRVYARGLGQVLFPWTLSGDYSAPQEPAPDRLIFPSSVIGALCMLLPVPVAVVLSARSWLDARRAKPVPTTIIADSPYRTTTVSGPELDKGDFRPLVGVSLIWVIVAYFPVSNIPVLLPTVRAERFWYFPVIATSILLALLVIRVRERLVRSRPGIGLRVLTGIVLAFVLFQSVAARLHANDYTTDLTFWDATRKAVPRSAKAHLNYSVMKGARGDLEERRRANQVALDLAPEWPMASVYLGDTLCRMHRVQEAWPHYLKGFELASNDVNLVSLALQCLWDEKFLGPGPKPPEAVKGDAPPNPAESQVRVELRTLAAKHPGSWLEWLVTDILANGETHNGVDPKYRPRGYNEGPKE